MSLDDLFNQAPKEVVKYFDRRPSRPSFRWSEWSPREHALGYTVARTAGFDVLDDIRAATRQAVVDRIPFEQFRAQLEPTLRAKGWWGERRVRDPRTGQLVKAQLGSVRRLSLIYDANIRSAEAAGDWIRIQRTKDVLPYLEYMTSLSERKRPLHLSWVGTTLPVDDSWWATHYPPNGWRCKCRVRSRAAPREGASTERPPINLQPWTNPATGESRLVPAGIDPGWESNPGRTRERMASRRLVDRLDRMGDEARRETIRHLRADPVFRYVTENGAGFDHGRRFEPDQAPAGRLRWPVAALGDELAAMLGTKSRTLTLSVADAAKIREKHPETTAFWPIVQEAIDNPDVVVTGPKLVLWRRVAGIPWKIALKASAPGELFLNSVYRGREDAFQKALKAAGKEG
ncbi:phage minor head protein [Chelatococcus sp. XZ-Ab1]|uniref:phage head morphogenesis protein n=1 Tax=Chelatococcus sp. XZ-Ab1 TaxID=3034027 RepID=UPI0023E3821B|nr:phage minor head protein [Chelatococcus sp. XZ-Ab1]